MDEEKLRLLYDAVSKDYDIGDYNSFSSKLADPNKRKAFYDGVGKEYDLGTYSEFESKLQPKQSNPFTNPYGVNQSNLPFDVTQAPKSDVGFRKIESKRSKIPVKQILQSDEPDFNESLKYGLKAGLGQLGSIVSSIPSGTIDTFGRMNPTNQGLGGALNILSDWIKDIKVNADDNLANQFLGKFLNAPLQGVRELEEINNEMMDSADLARSVEKLTGIPEEYNPLSPNNAASTYFREVQKSNAQKANEGYSGGILQAIKDGNYAQAGKLATIGAVQSLPIMLGMIASRGAGLTGNQALTALGIGTAEDEYERLKEENPNIDKNLLLINAHLTGLGEAGSELVGTNLLYDQAKNLFKRGAREEAEKLIKEGASSYLNNIFKKSFIGSAALSDASGEMVNQVWKNAVDKWSGVDPERDYTDGVIDAGIIGLVSSGGVATGAKALSSIINPTNRKEITSDVDTLSQLSQELENPNIADETKQVLQDQISTITEKLNNVVEKDNTEYQNLPEEKRTQANNLTERANILENALSDPSISEVSRKTIQEQLNSVDNELSKIKSIDQEIENKYVTPDGKELFVQIVDGERGVVDSINDIKDKDRLALRVYDPENKTMPYVANVGFWKDSDGKFFSNILHVDKSYRNKGIATFLYDFAKQNGFELKSSNIQTKLGNSFSNKYFNEEKPYVEQDRSSNESPVNTTTVQNESTINASENTPQTTDVEDIEVVVTEDTTPNITEDKLTEVRARREQIKKRLSVKLSNLNSGINPDALTDLVELGVTYIEEGVIRFKDFSQRIKDDLGKDISDDDLRNIFRQSAEQKGYGIRGFTERVRTEEATPQQTAELLDETEQLYQKQDYDEIRNRLSEMTDEDKQRLVGSLENITTQLSSEQNIGVLAGIELLNKYNSEGRFEDASKLVESLSKSATVAAQTLRQYGEFKTSTPDGYIQLVEKWLEKSGKKLTESQKKEIARLFSEQKSLSENVDATLNNLTENLTDENYKEYYASVIAYEDSIRSLEDYIDTIRGRNLPDTLAKILQGKLLSLKSVVINPFANLVQFGIRSANNDVATAIDQVVSLITSKKTKSPTFSPENRKLGAIAVSQGISRANRKAFRGTANSELAKYDVGGRLRPKVAFKRLFDNLKSSDLRKESQYTWSQGLSDFAESTLGIDANIMFRMLPYGDDPFFEQAKVQRLVEIGKMDKNLSGEQLEKFVLNPDKKSLDDATDYGKEATFQEDNFISRNINRLINDGARRIETLGGRNASSIYRLIMKGILPFINTPSSIALKTVRFAVPAIPLAQAVFDANELRKAYAMKDSKLKETLIRRHQRNFSEHAAEGIVSGLIVGLATILVANGLATGDAPEDEFQRKQRNFMYATQPPNTINISGLKRFLSGEGADFQEGDKTISYLPLGLIGAQIGIISATRGQELRQQKRTRNTVDTEGKPFYPEVDVNPFNFLDDFFSNAPAATRYFFNQSFVQGAETVLNAIATENGAKNLIPQLGKTFTTIGIPNTVSQAFRASNDYMRDLYTDGQLETFSNIVKEKVGNVEDLPVKYDMWGKPIRQTPEGSNPYVYQILDIFRTQKILQDPTTFAVFDIYRKTEDDDAIPGSIDDTFNKREFKVKLSKEQKSELTKLVGEERRKITERILKNYNNRSNPEKLVLRLKQAYSAGASRARGKFRKKYKI